MSTRDYDSFIFRKGITPNTMSVISSKNRVYAVNAVGDLKQLGVIATFDPSEARTIEPVRGIGFGDHIAELVPGVTDPMTISVTRGALYVSNIYQILGYKGGIDGLVRSLRHHRWPFDIRQEQVFSRLAYENTGLKDNMSDVSVLAPEDVPEGNTQAVVTVYESCWISDYSVSYASDTALVQETITINVSDILSAEPFSSYLESADYDILATGEPGLSQRLR
jgi:hypothetical protein